MPTSEIKVVLTDTLSTVIQWFFFKTIEFHDIKDIYFQYQLYSLPTDFPMKLSVSI